jgi:hypothetical protein
MLRLIPQNAKVAYRVILKTGKLDKCDVCISSFVMPEEVHSECRNVDAAYFWFKSNQWAWPEMADMDMVEIFTLFCYIEGERYPYCVGRIRIRHEPTMYTKFIG